MLKAPVGAPSGLLSGLLVACAGFRGDSGLFAGAALICRDILRRNSSRVSAPSGTWPSEGALSMPVRSVPPAEDCSTTGGRSSGSKLSSYDTPALAPTGAVWKRFSAEPEPGDSRATPVLIPDFSWAGDLGGCASPKAGDVGSIWRCRRHLYVQMSPQARDVIPITMAQTTAPVTDCLPSVTVVILDAMAMPVGATSSCAAGSSSLTLSSSERVCAICGVVAIGSESCGGVSCGGVSCDRATCCGGALGDGLVASNETVVLVDATTRSLWSSSRVRVGLTRLSTLIPSLAVRSDVSKSFTRWNI